MTNCILVNEIEFIFMRITNCNLITLSVYIPPSLSQMLLNEIRESIVNIIDKLLYENPNDDIMLLGDFNHFNTDTLCCDLDIIDLIKRPTRGENILDHVLISENLRRIYKFENVRYNSPIGNSDHLVIYLNPEIQTQMDESEIMTCCSQRIYDFRRSNLDFLRQCLAEINWNDYLDPTMDVNDLYETFTKILIIIIDCAIPQRLIRMSPSDKEWLSPLTKSLIDQRWDAYRKGEWEKYNYLKSKVKKEIYKSKQMFVDKMKEKSHGIWKIVKEVS